MNSVHLADGSTVHDARQSVSLLPPPGTRSCANLGRTGTGRGYSRAIGSATLPQTLSSRHRDRPHRHCTARPVCDALRRSTTSTAFPSARARLAGRYGRRQSCSSRSPPPRPGVRSMEPAASWQAAPRARHVGRLKRLSIGGRTKAVAHRVALFDAPQLADAARCKFETALAAKFMMFVLLPGPAGSNRHFDLRGGIVVDPLRCYLAFATRHWRLQLFCQNSSGRPVVTNTARLMARR